MPKRQINTSVSEESYNKLKKYAKERGLTLSALARYILNVWLTAKKL